MSRAQRATNRDEATVGGLQHGGGESGLIRELRGLPVRGPTPASQKQASAAARAAFVRAFDDAPWYARALAGAGRAGVPVVLASVVGLYLFWAFATAIALSQ